jgi:hypothetical protein
MHLKTQERGISDETTFWWNLRFCEQDFRNDVQVHVVPNQFMKILARTTRYQMPNGSSHQRGKHIVPNVYDEACQLVVHVDSSPILSEQVYVFYHHPAFITSHSCTLQTQRWCGHRPSNHHDLNIDIGIRLTCKSCYANPHSHQCGRTSRNISSLPFGAPGYMSLNRIRLQISHSS